MIDIYDHHTVYLYYTFVVSASPPHDAQMSMIVRVRRTATRWQERSRDTEMSHIQQSSSTVHHQMTRHANTQNSVSWVRWLIQLHII